MRARARLPAFTALVWVLLSGCPLPTGTADDDDDGLGGQGALSEAEFLSRFRSRFCTELLACNDDLECDVSKYEIPDDCTYDRRRARACLESEFPCTSAYGLDFIRVPQACLLVYTCPYAPGSGLFGGGSGSPGSGSGTGTGYSSYGYSY